MDQYRDTASLSFPQAIQNFVDEAKLNAKHLDDHNSNALTHSNRLISQCILNLANIIPHLHARRNLRVMSELFQRASFLNKIEIVATVGNGIVAAGIEPGITMKWIQWVNNRSTTLGSGVRGIDTEADIARNRLTMAIDAAASLNMLVIAEVVGATYREVHTETGGEKLDIIEVVHHDGFKSIWRVKDFAGETANPGQTGFVNPLVAPLPRSSGTSTHSISFGLLVGSHALLDYDRVARFEAAEELGIIDESRFVYARVWVDVESKGQGDTVGAEGESVEMEEEWSGNTTSSGDAFEDACTIG